MPEVVLMYLGYGVFYVVFALNASFFLFEKTQAIYYRFILMFLTLGIGLVAWMFGFDVVVIGTPWIALVYLLTSIIFGWPSFTSTEYSYGDLRKKEESSHSQSVFRQPVFSAPTLVVDNTR